MKRSLLLLGFTVVIFMLFVSGCPKKVPPPPLPVDVKPPEPKIVEPVITPEPPKVEINLKTAYFNFNKYDLTGEAKATLTDNAKQLMDNPQIKVRLEGNCDERGTSSYNLSLGEKRARSAKDFLVKYGISGSRIETVSYGEERPVCPEHNENCWWRNRKVDFIITAK